VGATLVPWPLAPCLEPEVRDRWRGDPASGLYYVVPSPVLDSFARMDADYYLEVAAFGYRPGEPGTGPPRAAGFLPGYPLAVRAMVHALNAIRGHPGAPILDTPPKVGLLAAFLTSNLALLLAALGLFRLGRLFLDETVAESAAIWLLVCPVGFFGSAYLAESLFLLLSIASLSSAFRRRMPLAALFGGAAALTRPVGVLLVVPLFLISLRARAERRHVVLDALWMLLVPAGLAAAMFWHARVLGDPWAYFEIQQRVYGHGGFPDFAGVADLFRIGDKNALALVRDGVQIAALVVASACTVPLVRGRPAALPRALAAWACVAVLVPLLSGHVLSIPRYLYGAFPLFLGAAILMPGGFRTRVAQVVSMALQVAGFVVLARAWPVLI
jgi:hypothetical protein